MRGGFDTQACIPLAKYDQHFLGRAEKEIKQLPQGSVIEEMLSDYAVLRAQNNRC